MTDVDWEEVATQWKERAVTLAEKLHEAEAKLEAAVDPELAVEHWKSRVQMRADRQRKALDRLNRKVLSQRFRLNLLKSLGRDVTYEEYVAAKKDVSDPERIDDYVVI